MARVRQILAGKGTQVYSISPDASALQAAQLMNEHHIGALVVMEDSGIAGIAGIVTERDVLQRVVAERLDPADVQVKTIMSKELICCRDETAIEEARNIFMQKRIRHLPVLDAANTLIGVISIGDVNAWELDGREREVQYLHDYIHGRG